MMKNFVKIGKLTINVDQIGAVYPHEIRGYVILMNGKEFRVSEEDGLSLIDRILDDTSTSFDPDRRISTPVASSTGLNPVKINKIRVIVNKFNSGHSYTQFTMFIEDNGNIKISKDNALGTVLTISNEGVVLEDTISNTFNDFKSEIIDVLAE